MSGAKLGAFSLLVCVVGGVAAWLIACVAASAGPLDTGVELTPSRLRSAELTVGERFSACARDPRVVARRVSRAMCAGADGLFLGVRHASLSAPRREGNLMF
jgi:hypothetical protein